MLNVFRMTLAVLQETPEHEFSIVATPLLYSGARGRPRVQMQVELWNLYLKTFSMINCF